MGAEAIAQLLIAAATLVSSVAALIVAWRGVNQGARTHELVNGQSAAIQQLREDKGHAEGLAEGITAATTDPHTRPR